MNSNQQLRKILLEAGIRDYGVIPFELVSNKLIDCRAKNRIPKQAQTVIVAFFPYFVQHGVQNISLYAQVPDYHLVLEPYLSGAARKIEQMLGGECRYFLDNSPIPEVYAAAAAGLGVVGDNQLLITPDYGSYVFIGELVTSACIPAEVHPIKTCCHCGLCTQACPAKLIPGNSRESCLSAITQKKGALDEAHCRLIKTHGTIWGCDICQAHCPHNRNPAPTWIPAFLEGHRSMYHPEEDAAGRAYMFRPRSVIDRNYRILKAGKETGNP